MLGSNTDSSPDLSEKSENYKGIVHTVGEMIYQSVLGYGEVAAAPATDTETDDQSRSPDEGGLKLDSVQELDVSTTNLAADANDEEKKGIMQSVGEIISYSAHTVKEAVLAHAHIDHDKNEPLLNRREEDENDDTESWNKSDEATVDSVTPSIGNEEAVGEHKENKEDEDEKGIVQSVGEMITQSAQSVKEVLANGHIPSVTESMTEESGERPSMEFVHTIVHD